MQEYEFLHFPPDAVQVDPIRFGRLPESARTVFTAIRNGGPLTHADLRDATGMPPRTIRFAVKRLKDEGYIDSRCSLTDCRTCYFFVHKRFVGIEALEEARRRAEEASESHRKVIERI